MNPKSLSSTPAKPVSMPLDDDASGYATQHGDPGRSRILVVDDNPSMLEVYRKILSDEAVPSVALLDALEAVVLGDNPDDIPTLRPLGFTIDLVQDGQRARDCAIDARDAGRPYVLAIVDMRMPGGWDGLQTIEAIWRIDPDIQVVLCTAFADYSWEQIIERLGRSDRLVILRKPFEVIELRQLAVACSERWRLRREELARTQALQNQLKVDTEALQQALETSRHRTQLILEGMNEAMVALDREWQVTYVTERAEQMLERPHDLLVGRNFWKEFPAALRSQLYRISHEALTTQSPQSFVELYAPLQKWFDVRVHPHHDGVLVFLRDVTAAKDDELRLAYLSRHDSLTGLPNRAMGLRHLQAAVAQARLSKRLLAVLLLDLDRFGEINDTVGYAEGDRLLTTVSLFLSHHPAPGGFIACLSGNEFLIILEPATTDEAVAHAQVLLEDIARPFVVGESLLKIRGSIGMAFYPDDGNDADELLRNAFTAMIEAKTAGGNLARIYNAEVARRRRGKAQLRREMEQALLQDEFELYYQPQVNLCDSRIAGAEALIRWHHPTWGLLVPADFLSVAEESTLITRIDSWVFDRVCRQLSEWMRTGAVAGDFIVSVNLSARQLSEASLCDVIRETITRHGVDARQIELEITETMMMQNLEAVTASLNALKQLGVRVALDDFGVGYSNLDYVKRFPVDKLKIDRSFVRNMETDASTLLLIDAIIQLGKSLQLCVVAEGVENRRQREFLAERGCDLIQGYLVSQPLAGTEFEQFLSRN